MTSVVCLALAVTSENVTPIRQSLQRCSLTLILSYFLRAATTENKLVDHFPDLHTLMKI